MDKLKKAARTSEFWGAFAAAIIGVLMSQGVVPENLEPEAGATALTTIVYSVLRVVSKLAKAGVKEE